MMEDVSRSNDPLDALIAKIEHDLLALENGNTLEAEQMSRIRHCKSLLQQTSSTHHHRIQLYSSFLNLLLCSFVNYLPSGAGVDLQQQLLELIEKLKAPLTDEDLQLLFSVVLSLTEIVSKSGLLSVEQVSLIINPLVMEYASKQMHHGAEKPTPSTSPVAESKKRSIRSRRYLRDTNKIGYDILDALNVSSEGEHDQSDVKSLQQDFLQQLRRSLTQISQFSLQLERDISYIDSLDPHNNVETFKQSVIDMLQSLRHGHEAIALNFDGAKSYLRYIESGSQQLMDELDRVRILSLTDELTGLPNRRAFLRRVKTEVERIARYKHPLSLVLIDLDYFKGVNDRYGHGVGDEVLKIYAESVFPLFRNHDLVARYGGEEFVILFPDTDSEGVELALHKIREQCARLTVPSGDGVIALPGFSAGVAQFHDGESAEQFIERADRALYQAKQNGRGRTEVAPIDEVEMSES